MRRSPPRSSHGIVLYVCSPVGEGIHHKCRKERQSMDKAVSRGAVCSLEGISGVGKSYLIRALRPALADLPVTFLTEVVDRTGEELDRDIIALLAKGGDRFFRAGKPLTETFL